MSLYAQQAITKYDNYMIFLINNKYKILIENIMILVIDRIMIIWYHNFYDLKSL